jgi:putative phosphoesterase
LKIAAISDIHADLPSLKIVWRDIEERGLGLRPVLNAGDTVAYGTDTMACIDFVRKVEPPMVIVGGNYDYNVARFPKKEESYRRKWGKLRPEKFRALQRASEDLDDEAREWLTDLPSHERVRIDGFTISISHYAPTADKEGLFADTTQARLWQIATEIDHEFDVVIVGHTHTPFVRRVGDILFVNPGSVGRSHGHPTYAEITLAQGALPEARIITCRVSQP